MQSVMFYVCVQTGLSARYRLTFPRKRKKNNNNDNDNNSENKKGKWMERTQDLQQLNYGRLVLGIGLHPHGKGRGRNDDVVR